MSSAAPENIRFAYEVMIDTQTALGITRTNLLSLDCYKLENTDAFELKFWADTLSLQVDSLGQAIGRLCDAHPSLVADRKEGRDNE